MLRLRTVVLGLLILAGGCVSADEINRAHLAMDVSWQKRNEELLTREGIRAYAMPRDIAVLAVADAFRDLNILVQTVELNRGLVIGRANAPTPLTREEWQRAADAETPAVREIVAREIGPITAALAGFDTRGFEIVFFAVVQETSGGSVIGLNFRPVRVGPTYGVYWPRYVIPTALEIGLNKGWAAFEAAAVRLGRAPRQIPITGVAGQYKVPDDVISVIIR